MSCSRTLLRHAVATRLASRRDDGGAWTAAGTRVLLARHHIPTHTADLPALLVYGGGEEIVESSYPLAVERGLLRRCGWLMIDCVVLADDQAEDLLDAMAAGVEAALEWFEPPDLPKATLRILRSDPPMVGGGGGPVSTWIGRLWVHVRTYHPYRVPAQERTVS